MSSNSILGPTGQNWVALGGERSWGQQRVKGDICCSFQWLEIPGKDDPHPCMVLFPTVLKLDGGAYAIPQDNAYEYARRDGSPTPHLMASATKAAMQMGFFPDQSTVGRPRAIQPLITATFSRVFLRESGQKRARFLPPSSTSRVKMRETSGLSKAWLILARM